MNLALFGIDPGAALPDRYAHWRPLVRDAVDVFLNALSVGRIESIITTQTALRQTASHERRLATLMLDSPLLHKLGQVLARHPSLSEPVRKQFQRLETLAPTKDCGNLRQYVLDELGDRVATYSIDIEDIPLAEASVAVVFPCRWKPSPTDSLREGVVKILKPGIFERLNEDLEVLDKVMQHLDEHKADYDIPGMAYRDTLESVGDLLHSEVHLEDEQRNMREAGRVFRRGSRVKIPALLPFCTPRLTAMERLHGLHVTDIPAEIPSGSRMMKRSEAAAAITKSLIAHCIFSKDDAPLYHADPHAGNLWATDDGQLGLLDWSLIGRLDKRHRETLVQIVVGGLRLSRRRVERAVLELCDAPKAGPLIRPAVEKSIRAVRRGQLPGMPWLTDLLEAAASQGLVFPPDLVLFRKSLFTLKGVLNDLDATQSADLIFLRQALKHFVREAPGRVVSTPFSRSFSTHLSNADLARLYATAPVTVGRFWLGTLRDLPADLKRLRDSLPDDKPLILGRR